MAVAIQSYSFLTVYHLIKLHKDDTNLRTELPFEICVQLNKKNKNSNMPNNEKNIVLKQLKDIYLLMRLEESRRSRINSNLILSEIFVPTLLSEIFTFNGNYYESLRLVHLLILSGETIDTFVLSVASSSSVPSFGQNSYIYKAILECFNSPINTPKELADLFKSTLLSLIKENHKDDSEFLKNVETIFRVT
jgi:hypothetical protein